MAYKHGTYGEFAKSIGAVPINSETTAVYVGTAPVNLLRGYSAAVNAPIKISNLTEAQEKLGYSKDWNSFTLCEAMEAHFNNVLGNVGPVVFINVLDPATHKKLQSKTESLTFVNGQAKIKSDTIILDTLALADKVEGTDYTVSYDFAAGTAVISSTTITEAVEATYSEVDTSAVENSDVVGQATSAGVYKGLGVIQLIYPELGLVTNIIAAPKFSAVKEVYKAMVNAATKINGHWDAFVNADISITDTDTIAKAIDAKATNEMVAERSKAYWPMWKTAGGDIYHLSTLATKAMLEIDTEHDTVPMESCSNKQIISGKQYFGASSTNKGFDQQTANQLNEKGITTAVFWGGINVLWGPHTAAYDNGVITDNRVIFDNSIRTMMHVTNSFQREWGMEIDKPMTKALAETIKNREQEKVDALKAMGALIGDPVVEFNESDNTTDDMVQGNFTWSNKQTPTPPFKSGTLKVAYTTAGFAAEYGGEA